MQIHQLKKNTKNKDKKIIGRGGKRGKTSGKGTKGQKARSGRKLRPEMRDIIKKIPKLRGRGKNIFQSFRQKPSPVNLDFIEKVFKDGEEVSPITLVEKKVLRTKKGELPIVKILGTGEITKKIVVKDCEISAPASEKIKKAGGKIG